MSGCSVVHSLIWSLQAVQLLNMHLLLLDLGVFLNLLTIKHIFISIRRLIKTSISTLNSLLLLNAITSNREALLLIFHRINLARFQCICRLLTAQKLLIPCLTTHSIGIINLRITYKAKLAWSIIVYLCISSTASCLALYTEANGFIVF